MGKRLQDSKSQKVGNLIDRCDVCGGELAPSQTTLEIWRGEELIVVKDIPADVCQQCNEAYLSVQISERLDHFISEHHKHRPERYIAVPQFSGSQAIG